MKTKHIPTGVIIAGGLTILSGSALPAPDKYTVKVPDGLSALSEVARDHTCIVESGRPLRRQLAPELPLGAIFI